MSLPILTCPTSTLTLPVSKVKVEYRPFIVKEQKIMLLAASDRSENSTKEIVKSITQVLTLCTFDKIHVDKLSGIDFEYLFIKVKGASIGTATEQNYKCNRKDDEGKVCGHTTGIVVDHEEIKLDKELPDNKIAITDELMIVLEPPSIDIINTMVEGGVKNADELKTIAQCVDMVVMGEDTHTDFTLDEMVDFIGSFTEAQISPVIDYFKALPVLTYHAEFKCSKCEYDHVIDIKGLENFFG